MKTTPDTTTQLAQLFQAGRHFQFLQVSHNLLANQPNVPDLAALSIKALTALGYGGPARELVQQREDLGGGLDQRSKLNNSLSRLPNGRVPWSDLKQVYNQNAKAFLNRYPQYKSLLAEAQNSLRTLHLFRSTTGRLHLSRRQPGRIREWICDLGAEPEEMGLKLPDKGPMPVPAIVGVSLGSLLARTCELTKRAFLNYNHPVYVVELDSLHFVAWMHGADHRALFEHDHIEWFIGPGGLDNMDEHLKENDALALPQLVLNQTENLNTTTELSGRVEAVQAFRRHALDELTSKLNKHYEHSQLAEYAKRLKPPGRVMAITSRFTTMLQYSTRDVLDALAHEGFKTRLLIEQTEHHSLTPNVICKAIDEFKPDLLIVLDHLRREYPFLPPNLPMLGWIQDPLPDLLSKEAGQSIGTSDFVCGLFRDRCIKQFDYPPAQFEYVDVPVSTRVFHDAKPSAENLKRYGCDVSFVSNASMPIEKFHDEEIAKNDPSVHEFINALFKEAKQTIDDDSFCIRKAIELTTRIHEEHSLAMTTEDLQAFATHYTYRVFDWGRRQRTLEWVSMWAKNTNRTFKIFGSGWENHPTLHSHAAGLIEHGEELRSAYRASKLSLQLIPSGFRHQRSLEIIASGSLPLTRFCEGDFGNLSAAKFQDMRDLGQTPHVIPDFPRFKEIVFTSPSDFATLAGKYLASDSQRGSILNELRERVLSQYTYDAALKQVLESFRRHLKNHG